MNAIIKINDNQVTAMIELATNGLSNENTKRAMARQIEKFVAWLKECRKSISHCTVEDYKVYLQNNGYSAATINQAISAIKRLMAKANLSDLVDSKVAEGVAAVESVKPSSELAGRYVTTEERVAGVATIANKQDNLAVRDVAIVALLQMGLRRSTIANLDMAHYNGRELVKFTTKRDKVMTLPLAAGAILALENWLKVRGREAGALFYGAQGRGRGLTQHRISDKAIYDLTMKYFEARPHDFRRTFVSDMLDKTDMATVAKLSGHESLDMVARYDRRGERAKAAAVASMEVSIAIVDTNNF